MFCKRTWKTNLYTTMQVFVSEEHLLHCDNARCLGTRLSRLLLRQVDENTWTLSDEALMEEKL